MPLSGTSTVIVESAKVRVVNGNGVGGRLFAVSGATTVKCTRAVAVSTNGSVIV